MKRLYTWGYQGRPVSDLLAYMRDLGAVCVDVRYAPYSADPRWVREALARSITLAAQDGRLPHNRVLYRHVGAYGNRNYKGGPIALADPVMGRRIVGGILPHYPVILLCVCRNATTCHRQTVGADLLEAGLCREVVHLPAEYAAWQPVKAVQA